MGRLRTLGLVVLLLALALPAMPTGAAGVSTDVVVLVEPRGCWHLKRASGPDYTFSFGVKGDIPLLGDWDGDGYDTPGAYRPSSGFVYLTNNFPADGGAAIADPDLSFYFGMKGDQVFVGDWNGDGIDTVGVRRRGKILLTNYNATSIAASEFFFGLPGDVAYGGRPAAAAADGIYLHRPATGFVYYTTETSAPESASTDGDLFFGIPGDTFVMGDWNGNGQDSAGLQRPGDRTIYLRNSLSTGAADSSFYWGSPAWTPVAGHLPVDPNSIPPAATSCAAPTAPLTGLVDGNDTTRILLAKYSNSTKAWPQAGINQADMVMEVIVEWGVGRWIAFFQTEYPKVIGPLRSVREVDPKLIEPFDARMIHSGGPVHVRKAIGGVAVDEGALRIPGYYRERGRLPVYDLMYDMSKLPGTDWLGPVPGGPAFDPIAPLGGTNAYSIRVEMSSVNVVDWAYSGGEYLRSQAGRASVDTEGARIKAANVAIVFVDQLNTGRRDSAGSPVPDYEVTGSGQAVVFRNGLAYPGTWARAATTDQFTFQDSSGNPIAMMPGRTWYHITPAAGSVDWS
jgi:hypothetical protein